MKWTNALGENLLKEKESLIIGILNVTDDSFFDGGEATNISSALEKAKKLVDEGADIIDVGGESTRPGAKAIDAETEKARVIPIIKAIKKEMPDTKISIDSYKANVCEEALKAGSEIVNDISGLQFDSNMPSVLAHYDAAYILMHIKGTPQTMQKNIHYENVLDDVLKYFERQSEIALKKGVKAEKIMLDPGIGFGKNLSHNLLLIKNCNYFREALKMPILIAASRKKMIGDILNLPAEKRLYGSIGIHSAAVLYNADAVRVHDVREMKEALKCVKAVMRAEDTNKRDD